MWPYHKSLMTKVAEVAKLAEVGKVVKVSKIAATIQTAH